MILYGSLTNLYNFVRLATSLLLFYKLKTFCSHFLAEMRGSIIDQTQKDRSFDAFSVIWGGTPA